MQLIKLLLLAAPVLAAQSSEPPKGLTERHLIAILIAQRNYHVAIYESQMACSSTGKDFSVDSLSCVERPKPPAPVPQATPIPAK